MEEKQEFIIIQQRSGSPSVHSAKESTSSSEMLTTLTPLVSGGHAASEQITIVPTEASMPIICGSDPTFSVALPHSSTIDADGKQFDFEVADKPTSGNLIRQPFSSRPSYSGSVLAQGSPIRWLRQSTPSRPLFATPVQQVAEKRKVASTATRPNSIPDSYTQSGSSITGSSSDVTSKMAAPMLDQNTVDCLHQALGIDAIVSSIRQLTAQMHKSKEEENDDDCRPTKRIKLDHEESENEDDDSDVEIEDEVTRFGSAFVKSKTAGSVNKSLADMMNKACSSTADSDFVKDMREKYNRPSNVPFLLVPTVNSSIYKKMSRFNKDLDHGLQRTQGTLCSGIYATSLLADKLNELKRSNPDDEIINELLTLSEDATFLLSHSSFLMSLSRREHLKHLFQGDYKDLCKKSVEVTDELFGSELSKACKDISEASRATTKMLKNNRSSGSFHSFRSRPRDSFRFNKGNSKTSSQKNSKNFRWNPYSPATNSSKMSTTKNSKLQ